MPSSFVQVEIFLRASMPQESHHRVPSLRSVADSNSENRTFSPGIPYERYAHKELSRCFPLLPNAGFVHTIHSVLSSRVLPRSMTAVTSKGSAGASQVALPHRGR
jgi:hypothetical protein